MSKSILQGVKTLVPIPLCARVWVPGPGRCFPPLPPWLLDRTGNQREAQPAPLAGTSAPSYWTPASRTSTCGANQRKGGWLVEKVCTCVFVCVFKWREGVGRHSVKLFCHSDLDVYIITDSKHTPGILSYLHICTQTHTHTRVHTHTTRKPKKERE